MKGCSESSKSHPVCLMVPGSPQIPRGALKIQTLSFHQHQPNHKE
ncbi:hypothetical protein E2C01_099025 [Portunus trituberculatus]|uniref:Uncharacterized protein n=1 Tax=Portunus trituberculatus TaxID=210409 RepID=A0A5B7KDS6_PORTR|nr:hypothetical protein [Portunus trituberculatus]